MTPAAPWPALVLAAGLGTRLRPLSDVRAKAALPVAGRPLIVRVLEHLREAGVSEVVVNLHHRAETITRLVGDGARLGLTVRYSWEPAPLGSGGGPARALPLLASDRFFIVNADTLAGVDLAALAAAHDASGALATLAAVPADLSRYNGLVADAHGSVSGVVARGTPAAPPAAGGGLWHFVGIQAVSAAAFAGVETTHPSETVREIYPALWTARPGSIRVCPVGGAFFDIGTPADYYDTVCTVAAAEHGDLDRGADCTIAPAARLEASILWDRVIIGDGAHLSRCIVTDDARVPPGVRYDRHVITRDGVAGF